VHYRNIHGKEHKAQVKPLALVQQGPSSYLVAQYEHGDISDWWIFDRNAVIG